MPALTPYRHVSSYLTHLNIFATSRTRALLGTYTLLGSYTSTTNAPVAGYRWLREGTVLAAFSDKYVYPNPSGNASGNEVGVLEDRVEYPTEKGATYNPICTVVLGGGPVYLNENVLTDGGTFGSVQSNTKTNLESRGIRFIKATRV